jgi:hypothetical protein
LVKYVVCALAVTTGTVGLGLGKARANVIILSPPSISIAFGATSIPVNGKTTLTVSIVNPTPSTDPEAIETGVAFSDTLPAGLEFDWSQAGGSIGLPSGCGPSGTGYDGTTMVSEAGMQIAPGATCTVVYMVEGLTAGVYTDTTSPVTSPDGGTGNTASASLTVVADSDLAIGTVAGITVDATKPSGAVVSYTPPAASDPDDTTPPVAVCSTPLGSTFPIGITPVTCTATDPDDTNSPVSTSFTVTVKGAAAQVGDLTSLVNSFHLRPSGAQGSFDVQLQAVQADLQASSTAHACSDLTIFINHAKAQSGKQLTAIQAAQLVTNATQVRAVLGC